MNIIVSKNKSIKRENVIFKEIYIAYFLELKMYQLPRNALNVVNCGRKKCLYSLYLLANLPTIFTLKDRINSQNSEK